MDLRDYLRIVRKGWPVILAFVVLGLAAGVGLTLATKKVYQADVQVFVATSTNSSAADLAQGNTFIQDRVQSYTSIANAPSVTDAVVKNLHLNISASELAGKISADAPLNKVLINLHVTDGNPRTAAKLANAVAAQFAQVVQSTEQTDANGKSVVKLTVIHPAKIPSAPVTPNKVLNIGLGFVVGLLIGVGVVVLRDVLDNTVKTPSDYEDVGVPAMGVVPYDKRTSQEPIAFRIDGTSARSEAYRQIRTNLQFVDVDNPPRIISVTSAMPGEGKSTTALNLAAALAEAGSRVCLIEADLRRPSLARVLGLVGDVGFTTALIGKTPVEDVLQNAGQNLAVLTSGPIPPNPSELLITEHARAIIRRVASHVDFVVIDTPPLLPVTDGATVATMADATLLVARTGRTTHEQAARSVEALDKVGRHPVGVVMNAVTRGRGGYSYEYGYYYTEKERPTKRLARDAVGVRAGKSSPDAADDVSLDLLPGDAVTDDPYRSAHASDADTVETEPARTAPPTQQSPVQHVPEAEPVTEPIEQPAPAQVAEVRAEQHPVEEPVHAVARDADTVEAPVAAEPQPATPAPSALDAGVGASEDEDVTTELPIFAGLQQAGAHSSGDQHEPADAGDHEAGDHETEDHETGDHETGDHETGDHETEDREAGNHETGDHETRDHETGDQDSVTTDPTLELSQPFPAGGNLNGEDINREDINREDINREDINGEQDVWSPPVPPTFQGTNGSGENVGGGNGAHATDEEPAYRPS